MIFEDLEISFCGFSFVFFYLLSFFSPMWIKKITCGAPNVQYHFFSSPMCGKKTICELSSVQYHFFFSYVRGRTTCKLANVQYYFLFTYVNKINHLWAHRHGISFYFSLVWMKKPLTSSQMCNIIFFLQLCE